MVELPKVERGDRVAVISPSTALPQLFPAPFELGLERLREEFGLVPVEYPTTRVLGSSPKARATDVTAAFGDPTIKAVFSSIGGNDGIRILPYLNGDIIKANPKPFFGYSDITHLHTYLWKLGIPSFYGCAVMTQLGFNVEMWEMTKHSLNAALFTQGEFEITNSSEFNDIGLDWSNPELLSKERQKEPNDPWFWNAPVAQEATGKLWGGCVESLLLMLASDQQPTNEELDGAILFLETAEDIPESWIVMYLLMAMGERGLLQNFAGILVGRPKAWELDKANSTEQKAAYKDEQRQTVVQTVRLYNLDIPIVQNLDIGHTDPQVLMPSGQTMRIDVSQRRLFANYG